MDLHVSNEEDEESECVLSIMEKTNQNLQEVLFNEEYNFQEKIKEYNLINSSEDKFNSFEEYIDNLYVSAGIKGHLFKHIE